MNVFNYIEEIMPYYNENTNTYEFVNEEGRLDIVFNFDLDIDSNIFAGFIKAKNIKALNIQAFVIYSCNLTVKKIHATSVNADRVIATDINVHSIIAQDIVAEKIEYFAICFALDDIVCKTVIGSIESSKCCCLFGEVILPKNNDDISNENA